MKYTFYIKNLGAVRSKLDKTEIVEIPDEEDVKDYFNSWLEEHLTSRHKRLSCLNYGYEEIEEEE